MVRTDIWDNYYFLHFFAGLNFYKEPLDAMYNQFVTPMMSRADWYALAGFVGVEYAAELTRESSSLSVNIVN